MNEFFKLCPKCGKKQRYSCKKHLIQSIRLNRQCRKCMFNSKEYKDKHSKNSTNMWRNEKKRSIIIKKRNTKQAKDKWRNSALKTFNTKEYRKKQSILQKQLLINNPKLVENNSQRIKLMWNDKTSVFNSEEQKTKLRVARIKQMKKLGVTTSNYNPIACKYIDKLNKEKGWSLQHALNGGEINISGYFLDGYDKERNIIVEYDEKHHYDAFGNLKEKDIQRQHRIIDLLKPSQFLRYNEEKQNLYNVIVGKEG